MEILLPVLLALVILTVIGVALALYATRYRRAGPNEALVISRQQTQDGGAADGPGSAVRVVTTGGTFVLPILESANVISLEAMRIPFDVIARFQDGHQARFTGSAAMVVDRDDDAIRLAFTHLQSTSPSDVAALVDPVLTAEIRARVATKRIDEIPRAPICFATDIAEAFNARLPKFGLSCLSLDLKNAEPLPPAPTHSELLAGDPKPPYG